MFLAMGAAPRIALAYVRMLPAVILIPVVDGPSWADVMTAFGTVGAVVAAVGIALWAEWRSGKGLREERDHSGRLLKEEREYGRAQIEEERRIAREQEQLAEAYAVQVVPAGQPAGECDPVYDEVVDDSVKRLAVMVVNRGPYTITRVEAQFSYDGKSLVSHRGYERLSGFSDIPERLRVGWVASREGAMHGVLTPWDTGIRFESDKVHVKFLSNPYPLVRWTDRWGTRWEHRHGEVRQVRDDEPWSP
jgi:hypothetical protein